MKYTPSALVSEFSGKQGSTVASHNRNGPYFRNRTVPVNPNTLPQQGARNDMALASRAWQALTAAQRAAWNAAASFITFFDRLGRPYHPTGHQYFVSVNRTTFVYSGSTAITSAPPTSAIPAALLTVAPAAAAGAATHTIAYTATPLAALTKLVIEATAQLSPGVSYLKRSLLRQLQISAAAGTSPENIKTAYLARFGALVAGKQIFYRLTVISSDGNRSTPLVTSTIVTA